MIGGVLQKTVKIIFVQKNFMKLLKSLILAINYSFECRLAPFQSSDRCDTIGFEAQLHYIDADRNMLRCHRTLCQTL